MTESEPIDAVELTADVRVLVAHDGYGKRPGMDRNRPRFEVEFQVTGEAEAPDGGFEKTRSASFPVYGPDTGELSAPEAAQTVVRDAMEATIACDEAGVDLPAEDDLTRGSLSAGGKYAAALDYATEGHDQPPSEALRVFIAVVEVASRLQTIGIDVAPGTGDLNALDEAALAAKRERE